MDTSSIQSLKELGFDERIETLLEVAGRRKELQLSDVRAILPVDVVRDVTSHKRAMVGLFSVLRSAGIRLVYGASTTVPEGKVELEQETDSPPRNETSRPKRRRKNKRETLLQTKEDLELLRETSLSFDRLMSIYDRSGSNQAIRDTAWSQAMTQAREPVHFVQLYFRSSGKEEAELLSKLKTMDAPIEEWFAAALIVNQSTVADIILRRVPKEQWIRWHYQLPQDQQIHITHLLGIPNKWTIRDEDE